MNKSESIKELATALSLAQKEIEGAKKDSVNPFFKSKYADLSSVWAACREPLTKHGLSVAQLPISENDLIGVETVLMHKSGEWLSQSFFMKPAKSDPQAAGSAISYARRYALSAIIGVVQEDDDGNQATHQQIHKPVSEKATHQEPVVTVSSEFDPILYTGEFSHKNELAKSFLRCGVKEAGKQKKAAKQILDMIPPVPLHKLDNVVKELQTLGEI